jgi:hypothetical protein
MKDTIGERMKVRDEIMRAVREESPEQFLSDYLLDTTPHLFNEDPKAYASWRRVLGERLEVDPSCILLVGSAASGVSLNPNKNFKAFDDSSDVDIAVISSYYFNLSWRFLRNHGHKRAYLPIKTRTAWDAHVSKYIYWGTITTDKLLGVLPFGRLWMGTATYLSSIAPCENREINFRLYMDHESLRAYQLNSVKAARDRILE